MVCLKKIFEREYVWRRYGREGMYEGNMRKNMYGENVEERECLEKIFERGYVRRKYGRECMFWRKYGREGVFGENFGERVCLEKIYVFERGQVRRKEEV